MTKLTKRGKPSQKRRNNEKAINVFLALIAFVLLMMSTTDAHASTFILSAKQPDLTGLWFAVPALLIAWAWCAKEMPKEVPTFDKDGYLISSKKGGRDV